MRAPKTSLAIAILLAACSRSTPEPATNHAATIASASVPMAPPVAETIVAIGDLHGDLSAARKALRLAGAIDANDAWIGGSLIVVQTGDEIDRGDDDRNVLDLFAKLALDAKKTGGRVVPLLGNHEVMNAALDFRYVTAAAFDAFADVTPKDARAASQLASLDPRQRGRAAAFLPGGPYAAILADRQVVAQIGDTVFVHGGVTAKLAAYGIAKLNDDTRAWLLGTSVKMPDLDSAQDGPLWIRTFSSSPTTSDCATLASTLAILGAKRLVMGHTVQEHGITSACDEKAWRIDVGMTHMYGGPVQVLVIQRDEVSVRKDDAK